MGYAGTVKEEVRSIDVVLLRFTYESCHITAIKRLASGSREREKSVAEDREICREAPHERWKGASSRV